MELITQHNLWKRNPNSLVLKACGRKKKKKGILCSPQNRPAGCEAPQSVTDTGFSVMDALGPGLSLGLSFSAVPQVLFIRWVTETRGRRSVRDALKPLSLSLSYWHSGTDEPTVLQWSRLMECHGNGRHLARVHPASSPFLSIALCLSSRADAGTYFPQTD